MSRLKTEIELKNTFSGVMHVPGADVPVGGVQGELLPYDMLFGALATCVYSTFLDIVNKKKISFDRATMSIEGEKRSEVPTTLIWVDTQLVIYGAENEKALEKTFELATKYCSIYQTISSVAEMRWDVEFR